jgi:hypothetical protein
MYVVIRKYRPVEGVAIESVKENVRKIVTEQFLPKLKQLEGFVHYTLAFLDDGTVLSVSLFNREATVAQAIRLASLWIKDNLSSILQDNPEIYCGEIVIQDGKLIEIPVKPAKKTA